MVSHDNESDKATWLTIAITAALLVSMSPETARAYQSADTPAAKQKVLHSALANDRAIPLLRASDGSVGPAKRLRLARPSQDLWID